MILYIVSFNIQRNRSSKEKLLALIKEEGNWACLNSNTYLVRSIKSPQMLRDYYITVLSNNDSIFVSKIDRPIAWYGYSEEISNWIRESFINR